MRIADDQHADRPTQGPDDQTRWQADVLCGKADALAKQTR